MCVTGSVRPQRSRSARKFSRVVCRMHPIAAARLAAPEALLQVEEDNAAQRGRATEQDVEGNPNSGLGCRGH